MKYIVRVEFDVVSTDAIDIAVEANSIEEARLIAKALAEAEEHDGGFYSIGNLYTTLSDNIDNWEVSDA